MPGVYRRGAWLEGTRLASIVRGADTSRLGLTPQSAGLYAISLGLSEKFPLDAVELTEAPIACAGA